MKFLKVIFTKIVGLKNKSLSGNASGSRVERYPGVRIRTSKINVEIRSVQINVQFSPRLRAETHVRSTALGGFDSPRLDLRKSPLAGVTLEDVKTSVAV